MGWLSNGPIPDPTCPPNPKARVEKYPFLVAVKWLEVDENVKRVLLIRHFPTLK